MERDSIDWSRSARADRDEFHHSQARQFENEARERLATLEANQNALGEKVDMVAAGQVEILQELKDLTDGNLTDDDIIDLHEQVQRNTNYREQMQTVLRLGGIVVAALGSLSGYIVLT